MSTIYFSVFYSLLPFGSCLSYDACLIGSLVHSSLDFLFISFLFIFSPLSVYSFCPFIFLSVPHLRFWVCLNVGTFSSSFCLLLLVLCYFLCFNSLFLPIHSGFFRFFLTFQTSLSLVWTFPPFFSLCIPFGFPSYFSLCFLFFCFYVSVIPLSRNLMNF